MAEARLVVHEPGGKRPVPVDSEVFSIGRGPANDLRLDDGDVSRRHAEILLREGRHLVKDMGSRFGTYVNGDKLADAEERQLMHGDLVRLGTSGKTELEFQMVTDEIVDTATRVPPSEVRGDLLRIGGTRMGPTELRSIAALLEGLRALGSGRVLEEVLAIVLDSALEMTGADRGFVMLEGNRGELDLKLARARGKLTLPATDFAERSFRIPEEVFATGEPKGITDVTAPEVAKLHEGTMKFGIRGVLCVPLRRVRVADRASGPTVSPEEAKTQPRPFGVLYLDSRSPGLLLSDSTREALETLASEAAVAIESARLYREAEKNARLEQELQTAREIQLGLLPQRRHTGETFDLAGTTLPCLAVGGDFFEYLDLPGDRIGFAVCDVSGKGTPAALMAMRIQSLFSTQAAEDKGPASTLLGVNRALVKRTIPSRFATMAYAVLSPDGRLLVANAGHNPTFILARDGSLRRLEAGGLPLGPFDMAEYDEEVVQLTPGDAIVLYSDGVTEALNAHGEMFEEDRLLTCLGDAQGLAAEPLLDRLVERVMAFAGHHPQADDITALVVRFGKA